jgi:hypothetical protein
VPLRVIAGAATKAVGAGWINLNFSSFVFKLFEMSISSQILFFDHEILLKTN